jgi:hypothetical protein
MGTQQTAPAARALVWCNELRVHISEAFVKMLYLDMTQDPS